MKTTSLLKAWAVATALMCNILNPNLMAQDGQFITNQHVENDQVVSETIYRQMDGYLYNHLRYDFTYDEQGRMTAKTAVKWNGGREVWMPYYQITYQYRDHEIIMNYARWNESHHAYDKDMEQSVLELNADNMPVASL